MPVGDDDVGLHIMSFISQSIRVGRRRVGRANLRGKGEHKGDGPSPRFPASTEGLGTGDGSRPLR